MKRIFYELLERLKRGEGAVLVTVIEQKGSTPRGAGAKLLVKEDKSVIGTIGGGPIEYESIQEAYRILEEKKTKIKDFFLTSNKAADLGMVCGGEVKVLFQYLSSDFIPFYEKRIKLLEKDKEHQLVVELNCLPEIKMEIYEDAFAKKIGICELEGKLYYVEPYVASGKVYVFGGGHVAQKLIPVLSGVGFDCVVFDDREEFINETMFPDAKERILGNLSEIEEKIQIRSCDYVCIMTRGHGYDYEVQKQVMKRNPCYIGVIGSKTKTKVIAEKLEADGFTREEIAACHAPIGLNIGAQTPEEIAISIAGEMILVRAQRWHTKLS